LRLFGVLQANPKRGRDILTGVRLKEIHAASRVKHHFSLI
jgi:hypothetical protein